MFFSKLSNGVTSTPTSQFKVFLDKNPTTGLTKRRELQIPNEAMKTLHRNLISLLRSHNLPMPNATGAVVGGSTLWHVRLHRREKKQGFIYPRYFLHLDIADAYSSVNLDELTKCLNKLFHLSETEGELLDFVNKYCRGLHGGLATGFPASPDLFNIYCEHLIDRHLRAICAKHGLCFTRYLDDLLFSSERPIGIKKRRLIRSIIQLAGFRVNDAKAKIVDLKTGPTCINGIGIRMDGKMFYPRLAARSLKGILFQTFHGHYHNRSVINGRMACFQRITSPPFTRIEKEIFQLFKQIQKLS